MTEQLQKDVFINEDLRYFQLTNIFFDRPLNEEDIITLKEVFFSINNISQIYFKDTFDLICSKNLFHISFRSIIIILSNNF